MKPKVVIYTNAYSAECQHARLFLEYTKGLKVREIDLTGRLKARRDLAKRVGDQSLPQVFIGAVHVGGYTRLRTIDAEGQLDEMLNPPPPPPPETLPDPRQEMGVPAPGDPKNNAALRPEGGVGQCAAGASCVAPKGGDAPQGQE
jgi:glutaredoxin 3